MADWNRHTVSALSWAFPFVSAGLGVYFWSEAASDQITLLIAVAFLVVWFGFRPVVRSVAGGTGAAALESDAAGLELPDFSPAVGVGAGPGALMDGFGSDFGFDSTDDLLSAGDDEGVFNRRVKEGPERRLSRMVEISEERAAKILRKWAENQAA